MKPALRFYTKPDWGHGANHLSNPYYTFANFLSDSQVESIVEWAQTQPLSKGEVMDDKGSRDVDPMRKSKICWLPLRPFEWLYDRIFESTTVTNFWKYDIQGFSELIQFSEYDGRDTPSYYQTHTDVGPGYNFRKITMVINLSDPSDYEGGDVELQGVGVIPRDVLHKGGAIIFPSFLHHQVLPVTSGIRRSLASWISGPKLK